MKYKSNYFKLGTLLSRRSSSLPFDSLFFPYFMNRHRCAGGLLFTFSCARRRPLAPPRHLFDSTFKRTRSASTPRRTIRFSSDSEKGLVQLKEHSSLAFVRLLGFSIRFDDVQTVKQLHGLILKSGHYSDVLVGGAIVNAYSKCHFVEGARRSFDEMPSKDLVSWNIMVSCCAMNGLVKEAFGVFEKMRSAGFSGDEFTFSSLLSSSSSMVCRELGRQLHCLVIELGLETDVFVGSAQVDMYMKCSCVEDARRVFDAMKTRNVVCWNAIIVGYGKCSQGKEAMKLLNGMFLVRMKPDELTLASILSSCADTAALIELVEVHCFVLKAGFHGFVSILNALIIAYAKNGSISCAAQVFRSVHDPNHVTWSSMVSAFGFHGSVSAAIDTFEAMLHEGIRPDEIAFLGVLSACSHAGLVETGVNYFNSMTSDYLIKPRSEHYACLIHLLGRAGYLEEACNVIHNMPLEPDVSILGAFVGACKVHGNSKLANWAADKLFAIEPGKAVNYALMSNIYVALGCWEDVANVRRIMRRRCGSKVPGCSWIETGGKVHTFVSADRSHLHCSELYNMLETVTKLIEDDDCMFDTIFMDIKVSH